MPFSPGILGRTGLAVGRMGVAAGYGVPAAAVERAFDHGINYLYWGTIRRDSFGEAIRNLKPQRHRFVLVLQSYSRIAGLVGWSLERALRKLGLDYADILLLGLWNKPVSEGVLDAARRARERGLVRHLALSSHHRPLVAQLAVGGEYDVLHFRYNAAHPGAERDIFPQLPAANRPGLVAFTATSWGQLLSPRRAPAGERVPTASDCYRFVLTRSEVDVCISGPKNAGQMEAALDALRRGPMDEEELAWMRRIGAGRSKAAQTAHAAHASASAPHPRS
ncbi:MAG TPA: aldo/keto reductase [Bryobacteraceae bacterium]|nr:aldo/keto reductase [Bryobacteraceae bacterium]